MKSSPKIVIKKGNTKKPVRGKKLVFTTKIDRVTK